MDFSELGLSPELLRAVSDAGYTIPTPIQQQSIPYVISGRDVLGCAQTGTGKTASFALPMIDKLRLKKLKSADDSIGRALKSGDVNAYMEGNYSFHFLIYSAQPRRTLLQLIETLWLQFGPFMRVVYGRFGTANLTDQHELMIRALRRRDAAGLKRALVADIRDGMGLIGGSGLEAP